MLLSACQRSLLRTPPPPFRLQIGVQIRARQREARKQAIQAALVNAGLPLDLSHPRLQRLVARGRRASDQAGTPQFAAVGCALRC
jgi:hypothetical protein